MSKKLLILLLIFTVAFNASAQDLLFEVKVDATAANTTETRVFTNMESAFQQFMNDRNWVEEELEPFALIKGILAVSVVGIPQTGRFETKMQVQSLRPIFNSTYESIMLNTSDINFNFAYLESQPMDYSSKRIQQPGSECFSPVRQHYYRS